MYNYREKKVIEIVEKWFPGAGLGKWEEVH